MVVIDQTETGYKKIETSDGRTLHQDPSGDWTSVNAFNASKGREKYEPVFDESGDIADNIPKADDESQQVQFDRFEGETEPPAKNFRSTGVVEDSYDPENGQEVEWSIEVWVITPEKEVAESEVETHLSRAARVARQQLPFVSYSDGDEKIQLNQPVDTETHGWRGVVRSKGRGFRIDFGARDSGEWDSGFDYDGGGLW